MQIVRENNKIKKKWCDIVKVIGVRFHHHSNNMNHDIVILFYDIMIISRMAFICTNA